MAKGVATGCEGHCTGMTASSSHRCFLWKRRTGSCYTRFSERGDFRGTADWPAPDRASKFWNGIHRVLSAECPLWTRPRLLSVRAAAPLDGFMIAAGSAGRQQRRANEAVGRRMDFLSDANANFEGLLEVNREFACRSGWKRRRPTRRRIVRWHLNPR